MTNRPGQADLSHAEPAFDAAASNVGLNADLLAEDFSKLMAIPVFPESAVGPQLAQAPTAAATPDDIKLLIAILNSLNLADLMNLTVESSLDLQQEIGDLPRADHYSADSEAVIAAYLRGLLAMSLSDLMSLDALDDLVLTDLADRLDSDPRPLNEMPSDAAGKLPALSALPPSDHVAPSPAPISESAPAPAVRLFSAGNDVVAFDAVVAGIYPAATLRDALGGNDHVTLPSDLAEAQQAGYDPLQAFVGGAGNDTIVAGSLPDIIDGGSGIDAVSYEGSAGVVVLLQNTDIHGPYAGEPAGGTGGLAEGDNYTSIENVIASQFDDYVFGGAVGGTVFLLGGNDEYDNPEPQNVPDYVDGGAGNDAIWGGGGNDTLSGDANDDRLSGESGADSLDGGDGADTLSGGEDNDLLDGGPGMDRLSGNAGDDILVWRGSEALLAGGSGSDTLRVNSGAIGLGSLAGTASGIERIDLASDTGSNLLTLTSADVISLSDSDILTVAGSTMDAVNAGSGWTDGGSNGAGSHIFTKLVGGVLATLVVSDATTVNADILT